jgi:hypothetical protein
MADEDPIYRGELFYHLRGTKKGLLFRNPDDPDTCKTFTLKLRKEEGLASAICDVCVEAATEQNKTAKRDNGGQKINRGDGAKRCTIRVRSGVFLSNPLDPDKHNPACEFSSYEKVVVRSIYR